jgi:antibiotic biosynthesis monooxygenase (ABM) superfamily enzyme
VIGGLLVATVATLFFVPTFFAVVHGWLEGRRKTAHNTQLADTFDEFDEASE